MTVNLQGEAKKAAVKALAVNSLDQLKVLAPMVSKAAPVVNTTPVAGLHRTNYNGASTPGRVTTNKEKKSEPLIMPTINWAEAAKEFASQN